MKTKTMMEEEMVESALRQGIKPEMFHLKV